MNKKRLSSLYISLKALVIILLFFISTNSFAGPGKTDFTGKWSLNEPASTLPQGGFGPAKLLNITQDANTLKVERTQTNRNGEEMTITLNYTLDGKECDNSNERRTSKSTLSWSADGKTLTINTTSISERNGEKFESKSVEIWKLSANGKSITIDQTVNSSRGERKSTLIYDKQ